MSADEIRTERDDHPYKVKPVDNGYFVVRPTPGGGTFTVDGPYNTAHEAEVAARCRAKAGKTVRR